MTMHSVEFDRVDDAAARAARFDRFQESQQKTFERDRHKEIAPPQEARGMKVTPEEYGVISYAYYNGLISGKHRSSMISNPHPEGMIVIAEAVKAHRDAVERARVTAAEAERKRVPNVLLLAVEFGLITAERMAQLLEWYDHPERYYFEHVAAANEISDLTERVKQRIERLDHLDKEHAAAPADDSGVAVLNDLADDYKELNVHEWDREHSEELHEKVAARMADIERARQNFGVEIAKQDIAATERQRALAEEQPEMQQYRSLFDGEEHRSALGGRQSKTAGAYYQLPGAALRLFWETIRSTPFLMCDFDHHLYTARLYVCNLLKDVKSEDSLAWAIVHLAIAIERKTYPDKRDFRLPGAFGLVRVAQVMEIGARKYGRGNWRKIEYWSEIDHAVQHLLAYDFGDESAYKDAYAKEYGFDGDRVECNLWNALTRLCFAAEVFDAEYRFTSDKD